MKQNTITSTLGKRRARKRVGRGGKTGTYSGRGMNGQNARSGGGVRPGFEGGQTPLLRRMPKLKGFRNHNKVYYFPLNTAKLESLFEDGATVDHKTLVEKNIIKAGMKVKLLGTGDIKKKITLTVDLASEAAIKKVEKAGGKVTVLKATATKEEAPVKEEEAPKES
jgi:large subunit ribosomal protein L15